MGTHKQQEKAKSNKKDEFYTRYEDIEKELLHYKTMFKNKIVYCNCDNSESNFVKYFTLKFTELGLKKLIYTYFVEEGTSVKTIITSKGVKHIKLLGNGSFDSNECVAILKQSDIVVTNPPFSRFDDIVRLITNHHKKFILLGSLDARSHKIIYEQFKSKTIFNGYSVKSGGLYYSIPSYYPLTTTTAVKIIDGVRYINIPSRWYTNFNVDTSIIPFLKTGIKFNTHNYTKFDNYDAINVSSIKLIPDNYNKPMGVPLTIFDRLNPNQFKVLAIRKGIDGKDLSINGITPFTRVIIQRV